MARPSPDLRRARLVRAPLRRPRGPLPGRRRARRDPRRGGRRVPGDLGAGRRDPRGAPDLDEVRGRPPDRGHGQVNLRWILAPPARGDRPPRRPRRHPRRAPRRPCRSGPTGGHRSTGPRRGAPCAGAARRWRPRSSNGSDDGAPSTMPSCGVSPLGGVADHDAPPARATSARRPAARGRCASAAAASGTAPRSRTGRCTSSARRGRRAVARTTSPRAAPSGGGRRRARRRSGDRPSAPASGRRDDGEVEVGDLVHLDPPGGDAASAAVSSSSSSSHRCRNRSGSSSSSTTMPSAVRVERRALLRIRAGAASRRHRRDGHRRPRRPPVRVRGEVAGAGEVDQQLPARQRRAGRRARTCRRARPGRSGCS